MKLILFLLLSLNVCCQSTIGGASEEETTKSIISQLNEYRENEYTSKEILKNIVFSKHEKLKVKQEESPKDFAEITGFATQVFVTGNEIIEYIDEIKSGIPEEDYFITNETTHYDAFVNQQYVVLKSKIDKFYKQNKAITSNPSRAYSNLKEDNEKSFNTNKTFTNKENKKVDFLNYKFGYKANIGLLTGLEKIQFEVIHFQYMFMNTIMGSAS